MQFCLPKFILYSIDYSAASTICLKSKVSEYKINVIEQLFKVYDIPYQKKAIAEETEEYTNLVEKCGIDQFPMLQVDNHFLPSFQAICRHLATRFGLHCESLIDETYSDIIAEMLFTLISIIERGSEFSSVKNQDDAMYEATNFVNTKMGPYLIHYIGKIRNIELTHREYLFKKNAIWLDYALQWIILLINDYFGKTQLFLTCSVKTFADINVK
uniref:GST N-terminal domain-containing protein n=1 Tax=Rhabditophanes sp. KR3021 TaxID=114890 RepID=A0AC35UHB8_9BILA